MFPKKKERKRAMEKIRGKRARHHTDPIEQEYVKRHGKLPDYHYIELWKKYGSAMADKTIQDNVDAIWSDMKESQNPTFKDAADSPFQESQRKESTKESETATA